ncbi:hypothetical protein GUJ93_ZPchr0012g19304 [Zizania palustris]|uniref:Uncharacterized protein n=2 Tax=Zizania palustris TaxID=103762 RepID=A0A8J6BS88_ZIZPA|nr:hypothetical protein GUJ93_ZPchr0012g19304 [Zizania palustris]
MQGNLFRQPSPIAELPPRRRPPPSGHRADAPSRAATAPTPTVEPCRRTPDAGRRTPDAGRRTPDAEPIIPPRRRTPSSGADRPAAASNAQKRRQTPRGKTRLLPTRRRVEQPPSGTAKRSRTPRGEASPVAPNALERRRTPRGEARRLPTRRRVELPPSATGTYQSPCDNEVRKREEKNRKQREYRARIKAGSSPNIPGTQQSPDDNETRKREERNRKQREYRASKNAQQTNNQRDGMDKFESSPYSSGTTSVVDQQSPYGSGYSTVLEASTMVQANELTFADRLHYQDELDNTEDDESRQFRGEDAYDSYCLPIDHVEEKTTEDMSFVALCFQQIMPPMLSSFLDQDSIVRYYVCEALYNIAKSAAHLLDRLVKVRSDSYGPSDYAPSLISDVKNEMTMNGDESKYERRQVESTRTREKYLDKIHVIVEKAHKTDVP